jgi:hypothetical protein
MAGLARSGAPSRHIGDVDEPLSWFTAFTTAIDLKTKEVCQLRSGDICLPVRGTTLAVRTRPQRGKYRQRSRPTEQKSEFGSYWPPGGIEAVQFSARSGHGLALGQRHWDLVISRASGYWKQHRDA